jgi:HlyD family secretion protein
MSFKNRLRAFFASPPAATAQASIHRALIFGSGVCALLIFGVFGLSAATQIAGSVMAPGTLVVDSSVKRVQHPSGGIVGKIFVRDGDHVKAGSLLVQLDATVTEANLAIVTKSIDQFEAQLARLEAERDGRDEIEFPAALQSRTGSDAEVAGILKGERRLFEARRALREGQVSQLRERIEQLKQEISGLDTQVVAKTKEVEFISQELTGTRGLWAKNLISIQRINQLERDAARVEGERGALIASTASTKGRVAETELQILQIDQEQKSEVAREIREVQAKLSELAEQKVTAEDALRRIDIRAPQGGIVHQLAVHTVGGVIAPGDPIMLIVPELDDLIVEAQVSPADVDQIFAGQPATLHFSAFDRNTTPEINGHVELISADLTNDQRTGHSYYVVRISFTAEEIAHLRGLKLIPGMPVEAFISTGSRTMLSYVLKPLADQLARSFREG